MALLSWQGSNVCKGSKSLKVGDDFGNGIYSRGNYLFLFTLAIHCCHCEMLGGVHVVPHDMI